MNLTQTESTAGRIAARRMDHWGGDHCGRTKLPIGAAMAPITWRSMLGWLVIWAVQLGVITPLPAQQEDTDGLVPLVIELLGDQDKEMRALGLEQVRTAAQGEAATKRFAAQLPKLPPPVQIALLHALTDRGDPAARPAMIDLLAASEAEPVRIAVIRALGFLGEPADVRLLLGRLTRGTAAEQAATRASLARLPGRSVTAALVAAQAAADTPLRVTLIEILVNRRAFDSAPALLPVAVDPEPSVRTAAMSALAQLAGPEQIPGMVRGILAAETGRERDAAEKAVMMVCRRIEDPEQQAEPFLAAIDTLSEDDRTALLPALGRIGGTAARNRVLEAIAASEPSRHDAGIRALCHWPNASVAPELIERVRTEENPKHQIAALRALIRVAPLPDGRSDQEKLELLKLAMTLCTRDTERNLVLQRARAIRIPETLRFLVPYLDRPAYAEQACLAIVELAHHRSLRESNKTEFNRALDRVIETSRNATVIDRAKRYKKGQTWVRPK